MKSSIMVLYGAALVVCVLVLSQIELSLFAPSSAVAPTNQPKQSRLMLATNDSSVNAKLRQRLSDLGQFLTQNSAATAEALETAEKHAAQLETELQRASKEHTDRLLLLEQRLAAYVKAAATTPSGVALAASSKYQSSPPVVTPPSIPKATPEPKGRPKTPPVVTPPSTPKSTPEPKGRPKTREEMRAMKKKEQDAIKQAAVDKLQVEVDADVFSFDARGGADLGKRLQLLHVPPGPSIPVANLDAFRPPAKFHSALSDMYLDSKAQIAICTIEKVASSELKKLLFRMQGDAKWRDEPWFKGGLEKIKFLKSVTKVDTLMNDPQWSKMVFLRHPFDRLVSCYKDKFGRDNRLYSVKMSGNKTTHILSFEEFLRIIAAPGSDQQNPHWRPQSRFCNLKKYLSRFNFVGNFESLEPQAKLFLQGTDLWDSFGAHGWGTTNSSMFQRNEALHRTSAGEVTGRLRIKPAKAKQKYDDLLPPGSELRRLAFQYYKTDFEMFANIDIPPFDNSGYKQDLLTEGG